MSEIGLWGLGKFSKLHPPQVLGFLGLGGGGGGGVIGLQGFRALGSGACFVLYVALCVFFCWWGVLVGRGVLGFWVLGFRDFFAC